jgi:hypothetical protein
MGNSDKQHTLYIFFMYDQQNTRYTIVFITASTLHGSGGFSTHHQELKNCTHSIRYMWSLLAATASVDELKTRCCVYSF